MKTHCLFDEMVAPKELKVHPRNPNKHDKNQIERLVQILLYQGWRYAVKVSKQSGFITSGHGRVECAMLMAWKVPVVYQDYENEDQEYADIVADNAIASWSNLDFSAINLEMATFDPDFDIDLLGIKNFKIDVAEKEGEDEIPENVQAVTKLGDLYKLGNHRLLCGDSTDILHVERLMDGEKAELVFTDPPYRMEAEGGSNQLVGKAARKLGSAIAHLCEFEPGGFLNTLPTVFEKNKMNAYVFCNKDLVPDYLSWAKDAGYNFNILFWKKPSAIPLGGSHRPDVEYLLLFRRSATWNNGLPDVSYSKCLEFGRELSKDHPTIKPLALIKNEIAISSSENGNVVDFFGGSGSTLLACEAMGRKAFLLELDPRYCDVIVARWEQFTGQKAELVNGPTAD